MSTVEDILWSWGSRRNALLYGPPATGKTLVVSELFKLLSAPPPASKGIQLDPNEPTTPSAGRS